MSSNYKEMLSSAIEDVISRKEKEYDRCKEAKKLVRNAEKICLYGMGRFFRDYVQHIARYDFICDGNPEKWGDSYDGKTCISIEQLVAIDNVIVIVMLGEYQAAMEMLENKGLQCVFFGDLFKNVYDERYDKVWFESQKELIVESVDLFADEKSKDIYVNAICNRISPKRACKTYHQMEEKGEYFHSGLISFSENEVYVDVGAYDGDSLTDFVHAVSGKYRKIYAFEMDRINYQKLVEKGKKFENVFVYPYGVGKEQTEVTYEPNGTGTVISENASERARIVSLDEILEDEIVSFIKMDIEGAEVDALQGATNLIRRSNCNLVVSVYHKISDFWEIPILIKKINPQYHLYLRHYTAVAWDTDCYAVLEGE